MFRLPNNYLLLFQIVLLCSFAFACSFVDFRPIKWSIEPNGFETILKEINSPVILKFDTKMNKESVEGILQVSSNSGSIKGDIVWEENNLYFSPIAGWTPGIPYTINLNGTINSIDGRELRIQHYSKFYAINNEEAPIVESFFPIENQSISINDFYLSINFSRSMDRFSVESNISIDGISGKRYEWSNNDKTVKIYSDKALLAGTFYKWTLKESAKSADGVPLVKNYSSSFITNIDSDCPYVQKVYPVSYLNGNWLATGCHIETGLSLGDGIAIEFSKSMDESVLRSVRFDPSLSGRAEKISDNKIVYIFSGIPEPEVSYMMTISGDTKSTEGLKIGNDYKITFLPDIPYLTILNIHDNKNSLDTEILSVSIRFSFPLNNEEKQIAIQKINLTPFFPRTLPPIALQFVNWVSDDLVVMRWEGIKIGNNEIEHFYKLLIPGGKGGISANGLYMEKNEEMFIKAESDE